MARGFFSGVIAGTVVSVVGLGAASVLTDGPGGQPPEATAIDVPAGSEFNQSLEDTQAALPEVSETPQVVDAPQVDAPEPDDLASLEGEVTEPAGQPEADQTEETLTVPQSGAGETGVEVDSESPVLPSPQAAAPEQPASEEDLSISTDPAQPVLPEGTEETAFPEAEPVADPEPTTEQSAAVAPEQPAAEPEAEPAEEAAEAAPEPSIDVTITDPAPEAETVEVETVDAETVDAETGAAEDEPASTIGNLAPEVETSRLPSVGDAPEQEAITEPEAETEPAQEESPPLERFAAAFENPEGKPLMSIILIDDGSSPVGLQALESFPYPLSFAVDVNWEGAEDAMAIYRASGFEVLALVDLPEGAGAQDAEVAMQSIFGKLTEAVAVMEGTGSGLQSSRAAAEQLAPILLESGHGAVFFPQGLNTAQQLLAREGVPAVSVFRDFDANGQNATVIRRFLDQAAFKAGQEDAGVVMVGRLRPDTVSALLLWGLQDRAGRVALAPISAMLRGE